MAGAVQTAAWWLRQFRDLVSDFGSLTDIAGRGFRDVTMSSVHESLPRFFKIRTPTFKSHAHLARLRNMPLEKGRRNAEKLTSFGLLTSDKIVRYLVICLISDEIPHQIELEQFVSGLGHYNLKQPQHPSCRRQKVYKDWARAKKIPRGPFCHVFSS
ncbi:hypothetical protein KL937_004508 [Ogataea polymorpha]|nr:hypothetical protein KL937_004508 [Ogataea polymorpha]